MDIDFKSLAAYFPSDDIEWRISRAGYTKSGALYGMVLAYITNRAIQNRLDDVCGPQNWKNEYKDGPNGGILCGLSIRVNNEWITKWDGAENTKVEAVKGGLSDSMKRAAVQWGIGRYLYNFTESFAEISEHGKHYASGKDKHNGDKPYQFKWNPPPIEPEFLPDSPAQS